MPWDMATARAKACVAPSVHAPHLASTPKKADGASVRSWMSADELTRTSPDREHDEAQALRKAEAKLIVDLAQAVSLAMLHLVGNETSSSAPDSISIPAGSVRLTPPEPNQPPPIYIGTEVDAFSKKPQTADFSSRDNAKLKEIQQRRALEIETLKEVQEGQAVEIETLNDWHHHTLELNTQADSDASDASTQDSFLSRASTWNETRCSMSPECKAADVQVDLTSSCTARLRMSNSALTSSVTL